MPAAREEIFGPVLQIVRRKAGQLDILVDASTLRATASRWACRPASTAAPAASPSARCGNVYVNRNRIGAVVGVRPFGGEVLSGAGPEAGGPHDLARFGAEQTFAINTAAGGNATLLAQGAA